MDSKQTKKLNAEELEKRVAPAALVVDDGTGSGDAEQTRGQKAPGKDAKV